ncbi:EAL domain-containing protein [Microvirga terricola]|uniref:EAL domain-containing protein n=1 Tax=Microvirga terricola TaxID=2719797 RepID=A0ABX0V5J3_9HYPH|nr:bifunctional diguanylate cyclase/phosphodiesterase [Microvirga terricola]NIX75107.1 EAL domain-containing protein [Microvirga terricola]
MTTRRHGRAGIFKGASRTSRKRQAPTGPQSALTALGGIAYRWDTATDVLTWGPNAAALFGLGATALPRTGHALSQMVEPGSGPDRETDPTGSYDIRYALRFGPDHVVMVQDSGRRQEAASGGSALVRGVMRIDPRAGARDLLPASINARSALLTRLQDDINEALRFSHSCALIVGTLDDESDAMEDMARAARPLMRRRDHLTVLAPNSFALVLTTCPASDAGSAMKRLGQLLESYPHLRLGAACAPEHSFDAPALLRAAEQALDEACSRNAPAILHDPRKYTRGPAPALRHAPYDLIAAVNDRRVTLATRPMADAHSRQTALLQAGPALVASDGRLIHLGPTPLLAEANLALLVDGRMLELAAQYLVRHPDERLVLPIADATFHDGEWLTMLAAHLGARPGIASRLMIEISETAVIDSGPARGRLDAMKALGIGLALGGFGVGHVTATHLQILPFDLLKVDGVFSQCLKRSTDDRLFVSTLVDLAHHLGMATAAEWVDDDETAHLLQSLGVDYLQGGAFGDFTQQPSEGRARQRMTG